ncbi:hypothetical protein H8356DRAFT_1083993 [Neocallimastix lanati (nom. inval.)]|uniref:Uncharacterized protein n=1 Tax=Neocallimastix californiae TaxID=1754190 RepID=A0A1Y2DZ67_9FUNG|nr:hypothetical protein H8356DRAFT_1083993 [Neocallimastix sp. JGI-2020a]ORY64553.1 hypothetical protein LY90DRAFT_505100 [Neocallimastix californiae]|eukprot:ORY64553.1 hypothetical protein LY90DRAFT_505100 [Neocallimastix californiae]
MILIFITFRASIIFSNCEYFYSIRNVYDYGFKPFIEKELSPSKYKNLKWNFNIENSNLNETFFVINKYLINNYEYQNINEFIYYLLATSGLAVGMILIFALIKYG